MVRCRKGRSSWSSIVHGRGPLDSYERSRASSFGTSRSRDPETVGSWGPWNFFPSAAAFSKMCHDFHRDGERGGNRFVGFSASRVCRVTRPRNCSIFRRLGRKDNDDNGPGYRYRGFTRVVPLNRAQTETKSVTYPILNFKIVVDPKTRIVFPRSRE